MSKLSELLGTGIALSLAAVPAVAAPMASHPGVCAPGTGPALQVQVRGFKLRRGNLRVQAYGGDSASFFEKGQYIDRIDVAVPASGNALICVPVARPGLYAVSVRHDMDGDRKTGRADGGGMSGNPRVSVTDLLFKRKPAPEAVAVRVGSGPTPVPIILNYLQGMSFRPISENAGRSS
jgi:uncharacterized protein (DUF2141 family)